MLIIGNRELETDASGYLKHHEQWDQDVAEMLASEEQITMTAAHWEVVLFVRDFYLEYKTSPAIRALVKAMEKKYGPEKGSSKYLYQLFPKGPAKQATRIAGLPKPVKCI